MTRTLDTQVAVVGAGPVGAAVANFLGLYGVETVLIERCTEIIDYHVRSAWTTSACAAFKPSG